MIRFYELATQEHSISESTIIIHTIQAIYNISTMKFHEKTLACQTLGNCFIASNLAFA